MIEVTDEMVNAAALAFTNNPTEAVYVVVRRMLTAAFGVHEANKPKPEPVAYKVCNPAGCVLVESRKSAEKLSSEYGNGTYQPLYTAPPTRKPLSEDALLSIVEQYTVWNLASHAAVARAIEQAHGIK